MNMDAWIMYIVVGCVLDSEERTMSEPVEKDQLTIEPLKATSVATYNPAAMKPLSKIWMGSAVMKGM